MARRREPRIPDAIVDKLLAGAYAKTIFDPDGLMDELKKATAGSRRRDGSPSLTSVSGVLRLQARRPSGHKGAVRPELPWTPLHALRVSEY